MGKKGERRIGAFLVLYVEWRRELLLRLLVGRLVGAAKNRAGVPASFCGMGSRRGITEE